MKQLSQFIKLKLRWNNASLGFSAITYTHALTLTVHLSPSVIGLINQPYHTSHFKFSSVSLKPCLKLIVEAYLTDWCRLAGQIFKLILFSIAAVGLSSYFQIFCNNAFLSSHFIYPLCIHTSLNLLRMSQVLHRVNVSLKYIPYISLCLKCMSWIIHLVKVIHGVWLRRNDKQGCSGSVLGTDDEKYRWGFRQ